MRKMKSGMWNAKGKRVLTKSEYLGCPTDILGIFEN